MLKYFVCFYQLGLILSLYLLASCDNEPGKIYVESENIIINDSIEEDHTMSAIIAPYRDSLTEEMSTIISYAASDFINQRPEGALGNYVTDITLNFIRNSPLFSGNEPLICMMNTGGLRAPISKGPINVGHIYQLMPFDNTIVLLKLPKEKIAEIVEYINTSGGEPISGFIVHNQKAYPIDKKEFGDTLYMITTDYLASGGDRMQFFKEYYEKIETGIFLRDVLIEMTEQNDTIYPKIDERIKL